MRKCERPNCEKTVFGRADKRYCSKQCKKRESELRCGKKYHYKSRNLKRALRSNTPCLCGCGGIPRKDKSYLPGHNPRPKGPGTKNIILLTPEEKVLSKRRSRLKRNNLRFLSKQRRVWALAKGAIRRSKESGRECDKTCLVELSQNAPDSCPCCFQPIDYFTANGRAMPRSPSIDRVDNSKGYIQGNIQVICNECNCVKNIGSIEQHQNVVDYMRRHLPISLAA